MTRQDFENHKWFEAKEDNERRHYQNDPDIDKCLQDQDGAYVGLITDIEDDGFTLMFTMLGVSNYLFIPFKSLTLLD